jgi:adenosyl cobinamide kinase/adenosyl cobinamide phosphate guanylyltransferase
VTLVVLLGGARSGKSARAVELAARGGGPVTFVATAEAGDEEMAARIAAHRLSRPAGWSTVEEPLDLAGAVSAADPEATMVVDCLSLWAANAIERGDTDAEVEAHAGAAALAAAARRGLTVAVSNEVGLGIVPETPLGRRYRDLLGRVNAIWVDAADEAALVVAGRSLRLEP